MAGHAGQCWPPTATADRHPVTRYLDLSVEVLLGTAAPGVDRVDDEPGAASVLSGQAISRTGRYKVWIVAGLALMVLGIGVLSRVEAMPEAHRRVVLTAV